ncbi:DUF6348 family protein [Paenibacillus chitinolyticus]|uniref:DUF6348 family protein n=1 Tax=Paenibacillus chitinolyticus TaxID=79263 RepID=UPI00364DBA79
MKQELQFALESLGNILSEAEQIDLEKEKVILPSLEISIGIYRIQIIQAGENFSATVYYSIDSPQLDSVLQENSTGLGTTVEAAILKANQQFAAGSFSGLENMANRISFTSIATCFAGQKRLWQVTKSKESTAGFYNNNFDIWEVIKEKIAFRLGNKKGYWVKIDCWKSSGQLDCDFTINDLPDFELFNDVLNYMNERSSDELFSFKQFFFIKQSDETFAPYPYTKEQIGVFTEKAIQQFQTYEEEYFDGRIDCLAEVLNDLSLAIEFYYFLPFICSVDRHDYAWHNDAINLIQEGQNMMVYKSQFASYNWIREFLLNGFKTSKFSEDSYDKLVEISPISESVEQLKEQNANFLKSCITVSMEVPRDYKLR